jgi:hypothetical protein
MVKYMGNLFIFLGTMLDFKFKFYFEDCQIRPNKEGIGDSPTWFAPSFACTKYRLDKI